MGHTLRVLTASISFYTGPQSFYAFTRAIPYQWKERHLYYSSTSVMDADQTQDTRTWHFEMNSDSSVLVEVIYFTIEA